MAGGIISAVLLIAAAAVSVRGCAMPHGGCRPTVCSQYAGMTSTEGVVGMGDYNDPDTWKRGKLPLIGFYLGNYNEEYGGQYSRKGLPDLPGLNLERFDLETDLIDPNTDKPYAKPLAGPSDIAECCNACAAENGCYLYQFIPDESVGLLGDGSARCYLLSGGTQMPDLPGYGTPMAGTKIDQILGDRKDIPMSYVGGRCNGTDGVIGDPHFTGAHGVRFDFNGELEKSFCLTTDTRVHINTLLRGYVDTNTVGATVGADGKALRTWIRELAVMWKDASGAPHTLYLVARAGKQQERGEGFIAKAQLDGAPFALPAASGQETAQGELKMVYLGMTKRGVHDIDHYQIVIGDLVDLALDMRVAHPSMQAPDDAEAHFNLLFNNLKASEKVHGVLGQTYRNTAVQLAKAVKYSQISHLLGAPIQADGETGGGFLEGQVSDYQTSSVFAADCKFSAF